MIFVVTTNINQTYQQRKVSEQMKRKILAGGDY